MRLLIAIYLLLVPLAAGAETVHLAAAASLRELAAEAVQHFERRHPEHQVLLNSASSGTLARQLAAGAPGDLFLAANPQWMTHLVEAGRIAPEAPVDWASNSLVVVGTGEPLSTTKELSGLEHIAIGSPESVPAGRYARAMLQAAGLHRQLADGGQLVFAKDVRQALLYAEQGAVDAAIVYASDARLLARARRLLVPAPEFQPQIVYPAALTRAGADKPAARELFALLTGREGRALLTSYGFEPLAGGKH